MCRDGDDGKVLYNVAATAISYLVPKGPRDSCPVEVMGLCTWKTRQGWEEGEGALGRDGGTSSLTRRYARERGQKSRERGQGRVIMTPRRIDLPATKAKKQHPETETSYFAAISCHCWLLLLEGSRGAGEASACVGLGWGACAPR